MIILVFDLFLHQCSALIYQPHHHTDASDRLGDSSKPVRQVVSDGAAHHGGVGGQAVDKFTSSGSVKKSHFLSKDGGED